MMTFWILAAGLAVLAVLFVLAPLLGQRNETDDDGPDLEHANLAIFKQKLAELDSDLATGKLDQAQYESAREDLEREALTSIDPRAAEAESADGASSLRLPSPALTALALALVVPASALVLYLGLGSDDLIPKLQADAATRAAADGRLAGADGMPPLDELVTRLEERLAERPDDAEGWILLGRTYFSLRDAAGAEKALARAYELLPDNIQVILGYAEALAANNDNSLIGRPSELINKALEIDADDPSARWLAGMAAFQRGQFSAAAVSWKKVLAQLDPESEDATELRGLIDEAEQRAGAPAAAGTATKQTASATAGAPASADAAPEATAPELSAPAAAESAPETEAPAPTVGAAAGQPDDRAAGAPAGGIAVNVTLAPELAQRARPGTPVFVYAKAANGPPMPLAVQQLRVGDLPITLRLDDSMAMMPAMRLSQFPQVIVGARVSPSGQAMAQSGDLAGETGPVPSRDGQQVAVVIDRVVP